MNQYLLIEPSENLSGSVQVSGAKNAVLVTMASLLLAHGKSKLTNVPASSDVFTMIEVLTHTGAQVTYNRNTHVLEVDTTSICRWAISPSVMQKMRASILVMGPLLARFGRAHVAVPGGCVLGARPIDYHLKNFVKMGVEIEQQQDFVFAQASKLRAARIVLEYPSVGATENVMMAATLTSGTTTIINAAIEPEVLDLIKALRAMGARIEVKAPATIVIEGVEQLSPVTHEVMPDRLEAGSILLAGAITGGTVTALHARPDDLDVFLFKLEEMGHQIIIGANQTDITIKATDKPKAVSFKTGPFPGFPTDLQAPMMAAQCIADGTSIVEETVFENRLIHARELQKMGAQISVEGTKATIIGVDELYGAHTIATDIRASCALVLAGLIAKSPSVMTGLHHWYRGYESLENKLQSLGGKIESKTGDLPLRQFAAEQSGLQKIAG